MGTRTDTLTEIAKPVADRMAARCGSLKHMLSAAVLAFEQLGSDDRERYMAAAIGATYQTREEVDLNKALLLLKEKVAASPPGDVTNISPEMQDLVRQVYKQIDPPKTRPSKRRIGKMQHLKSG